MIEEPLGATMGFVVSFVISGWFRLVLFLVLIIEVAKWGKWWVEVCDFLVMLHHLGHCGLGGGFKYVLFLLLIQFDEHIFQMGWIHQLVELYFNLSWQIDKKRVHYQKLTASSPVKKRWQRETIP